MIKTKQIVGLAVCLLATLLAGCSDDDLLTDNLFEEDARQQAAPFQWTRAEDVETRHEFLRNLGVGYSYNAVRGSYCDWQDIRCQVLNRAVLLAVQDSTDESLLRTSRSESVYLKGDFQYSIRDYVVNAEMNSNQEFDLGLYSEGTRKRQYFIEDGVQERYYYQLSEKITKAHQFVSWADVMAYYRRRKRQMFTESFRNAIWHLAESEADDVAAVDSFVNVWGTHVIVEAWLGAVIHVDLMNDMWRWNAKSKDEAWTTKEFLGAVAQKDVNRKTSDDFRWTEHARINIMARGGDQASLTSLLGEHRFDGRRSFSTEGLDIWRKSLHYDPDDELNSNVEMVDMAVLPIWTFASVISKEVAQRLETAIMQDAALMQKLLGDRNFFSARFPIRYGSADCQWRKDTDTWQQASRTDSADDPMIVNILSGGRFVATVCHETIGDRDLWVCYPIYEGCVKQACGLGVDPSNKVYQVRWIGGEATVTEVEGVTAGDTFYINSGKVTVQPQAGIDYPDYQALPYFELSGGVRPDATYAATAYSVSKSGENFQLLAPAGLTDIVGFTDTKLSSGDNHIYQRNDNYRYIYNQNEMK